MMYDFWHICHAIMEFFWQEAVLQGAWQMVQETHQARPGSHRTIPGAFWTLSEHQTDGLTSWKSCQSQDLWVLWDDCIKNHFGLFINFSFSSVMTILYSLYSMWFSQSERFHAKFTTSIMAWPELATPRTGKLCANEEWWLKVQKQDPKCIEL